MTVEQWNPRHLTNPCPECFGWGFYAVSKDPDTELDCLACRGTGIKPKEEQP